MITEFSRLAKIPEHLILGRGRQHYINDARQVYWLILSLSNFRLGEIARLNGRSHATVYSGLKRIRGLILKGDANVTALFKKTIDIKRHE